MIKSIAYAELLIAVILCSSSLWFITGLYTCPSDRYDCEGWAIFGLSITMPTGILAAIASIWFLKSKKWQSQLFIIAALAWAIVHIGFVYRDALFPL